MEWQRLESEGIFLDTMFRDVHGTEDGSVVLYFREGQTEPECVAAKEARALFDHEGRFRTYKVHGSWTEHAFEPQIRTKMNSRAKGAFLYGLFPDAPCPEPCLTSVGTFL